MERARRLHVAATGKGPQRNYTCKAQGRDDSSKLGQARAAQSSERAYVTETWHNDTVIWSKLRIN